MERGDLKDLKDLAQVYGADLLCAEASEATAREVEARRCTCGVRQGRYFLGSHLSRCPVRNEYREQLDRLLRSNELNDPPRDGYYHVHYLRYPKRRWVESHINHTARRICIVHTVRGQVCRFGVQPHRNRTTPSPAEMFIGDGYADNLGLFDILPERLLSTPFSVSREELTAIGADRPSPRSRTFGAAERVRPSRPVRTKRHR
jgi:hypothetical protein